MTGMVVVAAFGCQYGRRSGRNDHGHPPANQLGRQRRQPIELIVGRAVFDCDVLALNIAGFVQTLAKCAELDSPCLRRCGVNEPDHRDCRLLPARHERPRRHAAEHRDEFAPFKPIKLGPDFEPRPTCDGDAEHLCGLEIDEELYLGGLLDRQVGELVAFEDPAGMDASSRGAWRLKNF
jgi:hypothetical protein